MTTYARRIQAIIDSADAARMSESDWVDVALAAIDQAGIDAVRQDELAALIRRYYWLAKSRRDARDDDARAAHERREAELASGLDADA